MIKIPFNKPCFVGNELKFIRQAVHSGKISGDGLFSQKCTTFMEKKFGTKKAFLTPSGTHALELAALLLKLRKGDEVIVPSFTFSSTVNSFMLFGAKPKFVDIRPDTLNIDENCLVSSITSQTRAISCVHYAGVACQMDSLRKIVKNYQLYLIEDAAQAMNAKYKNKHLGTIGHLGVYSFHETKNYNCGEGGAILINRKSFIKRAEILREKGTDRSRFFRGEIDKYTWRDIGSSYLMSEVQAAYLFAQLEKLDKIKKKRKDIYDFYLSNLKNLEKTGKVQLPKVPNYCQSNYHQFHVLFESKKLRNKIMAGLKKAGILAVFHYLPLHLSPMGKKLGYKKGDLPVTESVAERLLRLPMYNDISINELSFITNAFKRLLADV